MNYITSGFYRAIDKFVRLGDDSEKAFSVSKTNIGGFLFFLFDSLERGHAANLSARGQTYHWLYGCDLTVSIDPSAEPDSIVIPLHAATVLWLASEFRAANPCRWESLTKAFEQYQAEHEPIV